MRRSHRGPRRALIAASFISLLAIWLTAPAAQASTFNVSIPKNSRVHTLATGRGNRGLHRSGKRHEQKAQGLAAVSKALSFKLVAPDQLAGEPRTEAHLIDSHGSPDKRAFMDLAREQGLKAALAWREARFKK